MATTLAGYTYAHFNHDKDSDDGGDSDNALMTMMIDNGVSALNFFTIILVNILIISADDDEDNYEKDYKVFSFLAQLMQSPAQSPSLSAKVDSSNLLFDCFSSV